MIVIRAFWWKEGGFMWKFKFIINVVWLWLLAFHLNKPITKEPVTKSGL